MKQITLTFDNGPTQAVTPHVLAVLRKHGIRASFFVLGKHIAQPAGHALMQQAHREGHWIGNHTFHHRVPLGRDPQADTPEQEIEGTQALIAPFTHPDKFFRPFGGGGVIGDHLLSPAAFDLLAARRYTCVLWNSIPRDWADPEGWVDTALRQCEEQDWTLTVLHDYDTGAMAHLETFIVEALARGWRFRQDFPPDCVPMLRGEPIVPMDAFIARANPT